MKTNFKQRYLAGVLRASVGLSGLGAPLLDAMAEPPAVQGDALPMTKNVISRGALDAQNPQDGYEALKNVAGVTSASAKGTISDNINIRGIQLDTYSSYRLNGGVSLVNIIAIPSENKERIEALKGANALMFGIASPAGIINLVTKRATDKDVSTVGVSANAFGNHGGSVDLGRKFGDARQFGLRVNMSAAHLETGVDGGTGHARFGSVAADWRAGDSLSFKLDMEQYSRDVIEQSSIQLLKPVNGVIAVPRIPDPTKLLSGDWAHYKPSIRNVQLRTDLILDDGWRALAEAGRSVGKRDRFISRINNYDVVTGWGINNITVVRGQEYVNTYAKSELNGRFATGPLRHTVTFGVMSAARDANTPATVSRAANQNIYQPVVLPAPAPATAAITYAPQITKNFGLYAYDAIAIGARWQLLAGMRQTKYEADNTSASGSHVQTSSRTTSPAAGAIFNLSRDMALYGSFMKGLEETGTAPANTVNQFSFLPPAEATQKELGVRANLLAGVSATCAYFDITRANAVTDVKSNTYLIDGTTRFQGLEATLNADINAHWSLNLAGQLMKAAQNPVLDPTIKGLTPENTPKASGNMSATHKPAAVPGLSLTAGASYTGARFINPQNQGRIPGVTLLTAGAGYATRVFDRKASFQLNIDNLANKSYWNSAAGGSYGVGMVRNIKVNAKFDL